MPYVGLPYDPFRFARVALRTVQTTVPKLLPEKMPAFTIEPTPPARPPVVTLTVPTTRPIPTTKVTALTTTPSYPAIAPLPEPTPYLKPLPAALPTRPTPTAMIALGAAALVAYFFLLRRRR